MTNRERFRALMNFQPVDRLPVVEWAPWWDKTIDRWRSEGLGDLSDRYAICEHFGQDIFRQGRFWLKGPKTPKPKRHLGGLIESMDDYERIRPTLYSMDRVNAHPWAQWAAEQQRGESVVWYNVDGFFWGPRVLMGVEAHLMGFYDQPELIHRINADLLDYQLKVLDAVCEVCVPDFICFAEDMSYNHGPMLSGDLFEAFLAPYYRRIVPRIHERGAWVFVDTDGDVTIPTDWYLGVGFDGFLPLERMAGVDVAALRRRHPKLRMIGAFDKTVMHRGQAAIAAEFQRLLPVARQGGFVISCDHQTPPGVSLADYQLYMKLFGEYAARAAEPRPAEPAESPQADPNP